jgi:pyridoxamine 5'-phosphate oxidase
MKDIADIRRQYGTEQLHLKDLHENPVEQFKHWLGQAIESDLFTDPTAMNVATVDSDGMPSQRIVLLKKYDDTGFTFFTNLKSNKALHIADNNKISLHFGWLSLERQVIIRGEAHKLSVAENAQYFLSRPRDSQLAAWASHQSKTVATRKLLEQAFVQMKNKFSSGDIPLPDFWGGYKVKPVSIEFWQGRVNRLHDRFVYKQNAEGQWGIERVQP